MTSLPCQMVIEVKCFPLQKVLRLQRTSPRNFSMNFCTKITKLLFLCVCGSTWTCVKAEEKKSDNVCTSDQCKDTAEIFKKNMNTAVLPCHNFYEFMCGNFKKWNPLDLGMPGTFMIQYRDFHIQNMVSKFLNDMEFNTNSLSSLGKARTLYKTCMDINTTERFSDIPIPLELNTIGLPITFGRPLNQVLDFSELLAKIHRSPFTKFLFDVDVVVDGKDSAKHRLIFNYMPSINHLTSAKYRTNKFEAPEMFQIRSHLSETELVIKKKRERRLLTQVITVAAQDMNKFANVPSSKKMNEFIEKRVNEVVDFLMKLEETKELEKPEDRVNLNSYTYITLDKLQEETDQILADENSPIKIDWYVYMRILFQDIHDSTSTYNFFRSGELIALRNMEQFKAVLQIVSKVSQKVIVSAMWWLVVDSVSPYATDNFRSLHFQYSLQINKNVSPSADPWECQLLVKNHFSSLFAHLLIHTEKNAFEERDKVTEMISNIRDAYHETISQATWLDAATKMAALNKLKRITQHISFSDSLADPEMIDEEYKEIILTSELFYLNVRSVKLEERKKELKSLWQENILTETKYLDPTSVNACYSPSTNAIDVPIGVLESPYYGLGLQALNYGAMGYVMSHEIGHAFDNVGKNFDSVGKMQRWWKKKTVVEYDERSECFVKFFNDLYFPEVGRKVNGKLTLGENIADSLGVQQALKAYRRYVAKHGKEKSLPNFEHLSHEKLLTMAFATVNCNEVSHAYLVHSLETNEHAPFKARVLGVLKNSHEFATIWKCPTGEEMNPKNKCVMW